VASKKAHNDATAPQFEEAQKKLGGHIPCGIHKGSLMPPFNVSRRVEGNQGVPFIL